MNNHKHGACPHCHCVRLERQHRGFLLKHVFRVQPIFTCRNCKKRFSKRKIKYVSTLKSNLSSTS